jgi:hypothetical protein
MKKIFVCILLLLMTGVLFAQTYSKNYARASAIETATQNKYFDEITDNNLLIKYTSDKEVKLNIEKAENSLKTGEMTTLIVELYQSLLRPNLKLLIFVYKQNSDSIIWIFKK